MPWTPPSDPVSGTVITVAYAVANLLGQIRWLRLMTGNADPPGSSYVVVADSTTGTSWKKVPPDALAPGAVVAHLGYTPANKAGDTFTGPISMPSSSVVAKRDDVGNGGALILQESASQRRAIIENAGNVVRIYDPVSGPTSFVINLATGLVTALGLSTGAVAASGSAAISGALSAASAAISGLVTIAAPNPTASGMEIGRLGGSTDTPFIDWHCSGNAIDYDIRMIGSGGSATPGQGTLSLTTLLLQLLGNQTISGTLGVAGAVTGSGTVQGTQLVSTTVALPPLVVNSSAKVANLNADFLDNFSASATPSASVIPITDGSGKLADGWLNATATPTANKIPIADASGKLDAWISPSGLAGVPSGAIVAFNALASLTAAGAGWTRHTAADGRLLVGDGTTFGQAFAQGSPYGASWGHAHTTPAHQHSGSPMSVSGTTGAASGSGNQANVATPNPASATQSHTHDLGTLGVAGNTANDGASNAGSTTWLPAMLGVVWGRKL